MPLEEQFQKETGNLQPRVANSATKEAYFISLSSYYEEKSKWLEEKLTWKKFGEQKPDLGVDCFICSPTAIHTCKFKSQDHLNRIVTDFPDRKWMYVPE